MKKQIKSEVANDICTRYYNEEGQLHKDNGPAIVFYDGTKMYYKNNKLHRENAPAIEWFNGNREYFIDGKYHRLDGPAIETKTGIVFYLNGIKFTETNYKKELRKIKKCQKTKE